MKPGVFAFLLVIVFHNLKAQIGIGTTSPHSSSILDIKDSTRGILIPRMTILQRNLIQNPAEGLMVFQTDSTKGYWYFDGANWKNINASVNYGGKHTLILSDTITNAQAQAKILSEFGPNTQELRIEGCLFLTTVDLSMVTTLANVTITDNPTLQSVNLENLKICEGYFSFNNCPSLTSVNVNSLEKIIYYVGTGIAALFISGTKLTAINFPGLKRISGDAVIINNSVLTSISFPALIREESLLNISNNPFVSGINFPLLQSIGFLTIQSNLSLTNISFASLTAFTTLNQTSNITSNPNLTSLSLGTLTSFENSDFYGYGKLPSGNVNDLLHKFISITPSITGKYIALIQTPAAPPTGQGITDKSGLIANGNDVLTN